MAARRLSDVLFSPLKVMNDIAEKAANLLVPGDEVPPPAVKIALAVAAEEAAPPPAVEVKPPPARKRAAKSPATKTPPSPKRKVKTEPQRDMPFRSTRRVKAGGYNEATLQAMVWRGTGSEKDPIRFEE